MSERPIIPPIDSRTLSASPVHGRKVWQHIDLLPARWAAKERGELSDRQWDFAGEGHARLHEITRGF